jgi:hypothetical protein
MKPDPRFVQQPLEFWAHVRSLSQQLGYTEKTTKQIKTHSSDDVVRALDKLELSSQHFLDSQIGLSNFGALILEYFQHRATVLNEVVQHNLMNKTQAEEVFTDLQIRLKPTCPLPMNKQKGEKRNHAFFTSIINMLLENSINGHEIEYDPRALVTFTQNAVPVRTLARRMDGCFPSTINPKAVWEIKEYYYTTTFGSRVADGVYETLLDGLELEEAQVALGYEVEHYLFIDDHFTWWDCGKSYLCRMIDMLHMGYLTELIVGREALERVPEIARAWVS